MKSFIVLLAMCICVITGLTINEWDQQVLATAVKCKKENNIDDETFKKAVANIDIPDSPNGMCFMSCIMENLGFVKDGKVSVELVNKRAKELYSKEDLEKSIKIHEQCIKKGDVENLCEAVYIFSVCSFNELKKVGIRVPY